MVNNAAISLARESPFRLGPVTVRPATRELVRADGRRASLEPRLMQVLTALARSHGEVVTRDDLTESCWNGRIVSEHAINRVISRLRRAAEDLAPEAFHIETVTKVGYRLTVTGAEAEPVPTAPPTVEAPASGGVGRGRRALLVGGLGAGFVAAAGGGWLWRHRALGGLDAANRSLYDQGWTALGQYSPDQFAQAVGLFRRVVDAAPNSADAWGSLAYAYARAVGDPATRADFRSHAKAAADRALQIDPSNMPATAALAALRPLFGHWGEAEHAYRAALTAHPDAAPLLISLGGLLYQVGRMREAAAVTDHLAKVAPPSPEIVIGRILLLWSAGRLEEAQQLAARGLETYPRNAGVWFSAFMFYACGGRPQAAIAMTEDLASRPTGIPDPDFDADAAAARAILSRAPDDVARAMTLNLDAARKGPGYAENAIVYAAQLGRIDDAFKMIDRYFVGDVPEGPRFSREQAFFAAERRTAFLFLPPAQALHADPRFGPVVEKIGLKAYWAASGHRPDDPAITA